MAAIFRTKIFINFGSSLVLCVHIVKTNVQQIKIYNKSRYKVNAPVKMPFGYMLRAVKRHWDGEFCIYNIIRVCANYISKYEP